MVQQAVSASPTQRVVARLRTEGWVDCPRLKYQALGPPQLADIRTYILKRLQQMGSWLWYTDLQQTALIFSVRGHYFEVHPHFYPTLNQLVEEGLVEVRLHAESSTQGVKLEQAVFLVDSLRTR